MPVNNDPYNREITHLAHALDLRNKHVLEIGCGTGRLPLLYQHLAARIVGVDLNESMLKTAGDNLNDTVDFALASAINLPFRDRAFDVALFSWSL